MKGDEFYDITVRCVPEIGHIGIVCDARGVEMFRGETRPDPFLAYVSAFCWAEDNIKAVPNV
jgi:hypothetical protein